MPSNHRTKLRHHLVQNILKSLCILASILFYRDRRHGDWLYEKMRRPESYLYQALNVFCHLMGKPRVFKIVSLVVEPVYGCNLSCSYCWHSITHFFEHKSKRPRFMTWDVFKRMVDQAPPSVESLAFALIGEPLLHPDIYSMIDYAHAKGLRTVLYTNGTLLSGSAQTRLADSALDVLVISVEPDEPNSLKHRGVRLQTLLSKIDGFLSVKPKTMEVKLSMVVHADNVNAIRSMERRYKGRIDHIKLSPMIRYNGTHSAQPCIEPWRGSLGVLTSGDVTPCCVSAGYWPITIGNIMDMDLESIANGREFENFLTSMITSGRPEICHRCRAFQTRGIPLRVPSLSGGSHVSL